MSALGYPRFAVQGGDFGASIGVRLAYTDPERIIGLHLNLLAAAGRNPDAFPNPGPEERRYLDQLADGPANTSAINGYRVRAPRPSRLA